MTIRVLTAAAVLMTALLGVGGTLAAPSAGGSGGAAAALGNYFTAAALSAGSGARNEEIRQRRVAAALSPLVIQSIVRQPRQIPAIMAGFTDITVFRNLIGIELHLSAQSNKEFLSVHNCGVLL